MNRQLLSEYGVLVPSAAGTLGPICLLGARKPADLVAFNFDSLGL